MLKKVKKTIIFLSIFILICGLLIYSFCGIKVSYGAESFKFIAYTTVVTAEEGIIDSVIENEEEFRTYMEENNLNEQLSEYEYEQFINTYNNFLAETKIMLIVRYLGYEEDGIIVKSVTRAYSTVKVNLIIKRFDSDIENSEINLYQYRILFIDKTSLNNVNNYKVTFKIENIHG